jgi:hypothetical protein
LRIWPVTVKMVFVESSTTSATATAASVVGPRSTPWRLNCVVESAADEFPNLILARPLMIAMTPALPALLLVRVRNVAPASSVSVSFRLIALSRFWKMPLIQNPKFRVKEWDGPSIFFTHFLVTG